jgi:hypothetical protein
VNVSGGSFEAITNGTCVNPLTFTIFDATGVFTTATLINQVGSGIPPTPGPTPLFITPSTVPPSGPPIVCASLPFALTGGTAPFSVVTLPPGPTITTSPVTTSPGTFTVSGPFAAATTYQVLVGDAGKPQQTVTATIKCI